MSDWTGPSFASALATAVAARADIAAMTDPYVSVLTYLPIDTPDLGDLLVIGDGISDSNESAALGLNRFKETVAVECLIRVVRPTSDTEATAATAAKNRAADILGAVDNELRTADGITTLKVGDQTTHMKIRSRRLVEFPGRDAEAGARICQVEFTVEYQARTSASSS